MTVEYMTTNEVAELCRTSPETVRFWRHVGKGPKSFKAGRRVLYPTVEVQRWLSGLLSREEHETKVTAAVGTRAGRQRR